MGVATGDQAWSSLVLGIRHVDSPYLVVPHSNDMVIGVFGSARSVCVVAGAKRNIVARQCVKCNIVPRSFRPSEHSMEVKASLCLSLANL